MKLLITICARAGSKGVPGKNYYPVAGKPLVQYSIEMAQRCKEKFGGDIELSTDSEEIKKIAANLGLDTEYVRPEENASDIASKVDAIQELKEFAEEKHNVKYDYVLDLDVTSPLRTLEDIEEGFRKIQEDPNALNLFSVSTAGKNPYFNLVEKNEDDYYTLSKNAGAVLSRQKAPDVFEINGSFYIYTSEFFSFYDGKGAISDRTLIYNMPHDCFDVDNKIELEFLSFLIENDKLDFEF